MPPIAPFPSCLDCGTPIGEAEGLCSSHADALSPLSNGKYERRCGRCDAPLDDDPAASPRLTVSRTASGCARLNPTGDGFVCNDSDVVKRFCTVCGGRLFLRCECGAQNYYLDVIFQCHTCFQPLPAEPEADSISREVA